MSVLNKTETKRDAEYKEAIIDAFERNNGDIKATARMLGVSREWVRRRCLRLDIDVDKYRKPKRKWIVMLGDAHLGDVMAAGDKNAYAEAIKKYLVEKKDFGILKVIPSK